METGPFVTRMMGGRQQAYGLTLALLRTELTNHYLNN